MLGVMKLISHHEWDVFGALKILHCIFDCVCLIFLFDSQLSSSQSLQS